MHQRPKGRDRLRGPNTFFSKNRERLPIWCACWSKVDAVEHRFHIRAFSEAPSRSIGRHCHSRVFPSRLLLRRLLLKSTKYYQKCNALRIISITSEPHSSKNGAKSSAPFSPIGPLAPLVSTLLRTTTTYWIILVSPTQDIVVGETSVDTNASALSATRGLRKEKQGPIFLDCLPGRVERLRCFSLRRVDGLTK